MLVLLPGRKGQDGDLGAATALVLSTLWQRRGTAGARGLLQAFRALLLPSPWFPLLGRLASLSGNLHKMTNQVSTGRAKVLRILARQALNCRTGQPLL